MIGRIREFRFSVTTFGRGLPAFLLRYIRSRPLTQLWVAGPGIAFSLLLACVFVCVGTTSQQNSLYRKYVRLSERAVEQSDVVAAELYFNRALQSSEDPQELTFQFARRLYEESADRDDRSHALLSIHGLPSEDNDPMMSRALALMQSLAPRQASAVHHPAAHVFMAEFWHNREPATDVTQFLHLQHIMLAFPEDLSAVLQLAEFLTTKGYHEHAIDILKPRQRDDTRAQLLLAANYAKHGEKYLADRCLEKAIARLQLALRHDPQDVVARLDLSRALAAQGQVLASLFLLAEGCTISDAEQLTDPLIQRYTVWLSLMSPQKARAQLADIDLALKFAPSAASFSPVDNDTADLLLSSGVRVTLPTPIVKFHHALLEGSNTFLVPLLLGTERAGQGQLIEAKALLEVALAAAPEHPVVANNLACTLSQLADRGAEAVSLDRKPLSPTLLDERDPHSASQVHIASMLAEAWRLADSAVETCPDNLAFRETRGTAAARTKRWRVAVEDLQICADAGYQTADLRHYLSLAKERLQLSDRPQ